MVAGLFALHGVWFGSDADPTQWNPRGSFESRPIKDLLARRFGRIRSIMDVPESLPEATNLFLSELDWTMREDGYAGGRWFFKGSGFYHRVFEPLDPIYITVRRAPCSIASSIRKAGWVHHADLERAIDAHTAVLDALEAGGAHRVESEALIERDYRQISDVFDNCGLRFNAETADDWIDPSLWHFKSDEHPTTRITR